MKNFVSNLVLFFLLVINSIHSQQQNWTWQNPLPQGNDLYQVKVIDENLIYAIGNGGTVMKSADGGITWTILNTGTAKNLRNADFLLNGLIGYAVGVDSTIRKTSDGGISWRNLSVNQNIHLSSIDFIDEQTGFVGGGPGTRILKTTDGGLNWSQSDSLDMLTVSAIKFPSDNLTGFVSGWDGTLNSSIYKTTDGGDSWIKKTLPVVSMIKSLWFVNNQTGYAVGSNNILKTTDAGESWFSVYSTLPGGNSICFPENELTGYVVANFNTVLKTTDGGSSWQTINTNVSGTHFYNSVQFVNNQLGFIVGTNGIILKTSDGGQSWFNLRPCVAVGWLQSINFPVNSQTGFIAGLGGLILKTDNGGNLWTQQNTNTGRSLNKIQFLDNDSGYAVGNNGTILKTVDGGINWISLASGFSQDLYDVEFPVNSLIGYVSGGSGKLAKTTDGGNTWVSIGSFNKDIMAMCFSADDLIGYVTTGYERIYKTTDGGVNWDIKHDGNNPNTNIADILFPFDTETGYVLSSTGSQSNKILKTTDGGNSWAIIDAGTSSSLQSISFPTPQVGYIAADGMYGTNPTPFLKTTDGGLNWNFVSVPYGYSLMSVCFPKGVDTGYVVGNQSGAILKTFNGGGTITSVFDLQIDPPVSDHKLLQNYPNPFNPVTIIQYTITNSEFVTLKVVDILGREVASLVNEGKAVGTYEVNWNAANLPSGVYFYKLQAGEFVQTRKMILLK